MPNYLVGEAALLPWSYRHSHTFSASSYWPRMVYPKGQEDNGLISSRHHELPMFAESFPSPAASWTSSRSRSGPASVPLRFSRPSSRPLSRTAKASLRAIRPLHFSSSSLSFAAIRSSLIQSTHRWARVLTILPRSLQESGGAVRVSAMCQYLSLGQRAKPLLLLARERRCGTSDELFCAREQAP